MQNRLIYVKFDLEIENVDDDIEIEFEIVFSRKAKSTREFFVNLTMMTIFDKILDRSRIYLMIKSIKNRLQTSNQKMIKTSMKTTQFNLDKKVRILIERFRYQRLRRNVLKKKYMIISMNHRMMFVFHIDMKIFNRMKMLDL
jgi:hypothetical protein